METTPRHLTGLQRVLKLYGRSTVSAEGRSVTWLWDYARDEPVKEIEMPVGSKRWKASEKARRNVS